MWRATLRGLLARKVRLALTALAVLLGVAFISGTYVLTDTLDQSFQGFFRQKVAGIDLVVQRPGAFEGDRDRNRVPNSAVTEVRQVAGVQSAYGFLQDYAQFVDQKGASIQTGGAPTFGLTWSQKGNDGPLKILPRPVRKGGCLVGSSREPRRDGEVAMDVGTATAYNFRPGDEVDILLQGPKESFCITGLFSFGTAKDPLAVTFAAFDVATAQRVFDSPGEVDQIFVVADSGVNPVALRTKIQNSLAGDYEVVLGEAFAASQSADVTSFFSLLTQLLLGFAAIGLFVGAFIIFNTFSILVAQRTREFGLLRAMGARGRQVVVAVIAEATLVGVIASVAGLFAGIGLAALLLGVLGSVGFEVPSGSLVISQRTLVVAAAVGILVTIAASVAPALRASRISPMAAINDVRSSAERSLHWRWVIGSIFIAASVPILIIGIERSQNALSITDEIWIVAVGALLLFFGAVTLLAAFARPLVAVLGMPLRLFGVSGSLARANAMRNPRRTSATASALVVGLALVGLVTIFGASAKVSVADTIDRGIRADLILKAQQFANFSPQVADLVKGVPEVDAVAPFQFGNVRVDANEETVAGTALSQLDRVADLGLTAGVISTDDPNGALVSTAAAQRYRLKVGSSYYLLGPETPTQARPVVITGIFSQDDFTGGLPVSFVVGESKYAELFGAKSQDSLIYLSTQSGKADAAQREVKKIVQADFPNVSVLTRQEYKNDQEKAIDRFLTITVALLFLAEIIAVLGIINTLALSVYERTREIGLLRAVGTTRRQIRRMVRGESVLVALLGGVVGITVGIIWGWAFTSALKTRVNIISIPITQLLIFVALSMVAGVIAAIAPAWRAGRLELLEAISTE